MLFIFIVCALLVAVDQFIKWLATVNLASVDSMVMIPGVVGLRYVENDGAAFSILAGRQTLLIVVTGLALLAAVIFVLRFRRLQGRLESVIFILILSGGVGNLIDRVLQGYVVDYIDLLFVNFAVFNFADCMVVVGFILLVFAVIRSECKASKEAKKKAAAPDGHVNDGED